MYIGEVELVDKVKICYIVKEAEEIEVDKALKFNKKTFVAACFYFINNSFFLFYSYFFFSTFFVD